jgi:hypothetical protein
MILNKKQKKTFELIYNLTNNYYEQRRNDKTC